MSEDTEVKVEKVTLTGYRAVILSEYPFTEGQTFEAWYEALPEDVKEKLLAGARSPKNQIRHLRNAFYQMYPSAPRTSRRSGGKKSKRSKSSDEGLDMELDLDGDEDDEEGWDGEEE